MSKKNTWTREAMAVEKQNVKLAKSLWPSDLEPRHLCALKKLSGEFGLSLASGELLLLNGSWYVTAAGLLRLAKQNRCSGIDTHLLLKLSDAKSGRWVFKATVYKSPRSRGFVGYGDADPSNVSPLVRGAEMRVAETRAVNRALRKAYGIGLCSVEELGSRPSFVEPTNRNAPHFAGSGDGSGVSQSCLRDRLCLLIRKHRLDSGLVKRYAADFCGTTVLRDASRDRVESFINMLTESASKDRDGLLCKLNGYAQTEEVHS
jgi:hypothetical protein